MTSRDFDLAIDKLKELDPKGWKLAYPRFYDIPNGYASPKIPSALMFGSCITVRMARASDIEVSEGTVISAAVMSGLARYRVPLYFVSRDLLEAILLSDLPKNIAWPEIDMPMAAAVFMLPLGVVKHPIEGNIPFIAYLKSVKGVPQPDPFHYFKDLVADNTSFSTVAAATEMPNSPIYHTCIREDAQIHSHEAIHEYLHGMQPDYTGWGSLKMDEADRLFNEEMTAIVFRLIMAMHAKPELVSTGSFTGKRLSKGEGPEIWTPNFIGRNYRCKREGPSDGGGWHVRMHWRRGHMRQQPYGPRNTLRKTIWIEPCLISGDTGDTKSA